MKFQGLYTAIVTPFVGNRVDEEAFRMLVEAQVAAGVAGIVAVGNDVQVRGTKQTGSILIDRMTIAGE